ncbi:MAG: type II toxin-antitoxin system RelE/ParE family toxin [Candidatus Delongbacteria bacterium]
MYKDKYHPKVKKDLKKIDKPVQNDIIENQLNKILSNPEEAGNALHGDLEGIRSFHFTKNKVEYRIAYLIDSDASTVYVLSIAKRENFYDLLKNRI